jgi:hypothetical protein
MPTAPQKSLRSTSASGVGQDEDHQDVLQRLREHLEGLRFGHVTLTVHDGVIVQVERVERVRVPIR